MHIDTGEARFAGAERASGRGAQVHARTGGRLVRLARAKSARLACQSALGRGCLASPRAGRRCGTSAAAR